MADRHATFAVLSNKGPKPATRDVTNVVDMLALSQYFRRLYTAENPVLLSSHMWNLYKQDSMVNRTINQYTEQAFADAYVKPLVFNSVIQQEVDRWWNENKWKRKIWRGYKQFAITGEQWVYMPARANRTLGGRLLTSWNVAQVTGFEPEDWTSAFYGGSNAAQLQDDTVTKLTPKNTSYVANDAMFESMRGVTPFVSLYFGVDRYRKWLDARERLTRVASNIVGHIHFATIEDAAASLGWEKDSKGTFTPKEVAMPNDGTVAVTIGEGASFQVLVPDTHGGDAEADGRAFYNQANEGTRLPEYWSGDGRQVNVATAKVQYPVAIRSILSLRDFYTEALSDMIRLLLTRLVAMGVISDTWIAVMPNGDRVEQTPESAIVEFTWPEIRELDYSDLFSTFTWLHDQQLLSGDWLLRYFGFDPEIVKPDPNEVENGGEAEPPETDSPDEGLRATARAELKEALASKPS